MLTPCSCTTLWCLRECTGNRVRREWQSGETTFLSAAWQDDWALPTKRHPEQTGIAREHVARGWGEVNPTSSEWDGEGGSSWLFRAP